MKLGKSLLIAGTIAATAALSACGKSDEVTALEQTVAKFETGIESCASKEKMEKVNCLNGVSTTFAQQWGQEAAKVSADDAEYLAELSEKTTALTEKMSKMIEEAMM